MSIKQKTISGLKWSFIDNFSGQAITFTIGIILARLITPKEFGLIGMIGIFLAISQTFVDSGFIQTLVRKQNATQSDYSTVFFYNMFVGALFYFLMFSLSGYIADFYKEPQLKLIVRVLAIGILINAVSMIQTTQLLKRLDFKLQTKISLTANILSGILGISLAYFGFGVWSLIWRTLFLSIIVAFMLWINIKWKPTLEFNKQSFKELFGFGSKLMLVGLIDTTYKNIYYLVIGKYFSAKELGFYTRADQFKDLPSQNLNGVISKVTYPVLSTMQDDKPRLKDNYQKIIKATMLLTFVLMLGMAAVAEPLIITLIGEKWRASIIYLQMLCFVGMFYPLHALNLNMLQVQGRSDLFLKLEIIKKTLAIPTIIIGIVWGIKVMIAGMFINTIIAYYLNSYWSGKHINYPMKEQVKDILPAFILALIMSIIVYITSIFLPFSSIINLILLVILGATIIFTICELFKLKDYMYLKDILIQQFATLKNSDKK